MKRSTVLLVAVLAICGFSSVATAGESTLDLVKKRGKLIAGVRYDAPPWGSVDKEGKVIGFDVDIARYFAQKLGVELELVQVTAKTRIPMLVNGNVDILTAGMAHTHICII